MSVVGTLASFRCGAKVQALLRVKRTCRARRDCVDLTKMTHCGHSLGRNPAAQQSPTVLRCAIVWGGSTGGVGSNPPRFRTIQVCPKDLPDTLRQAERAVNRASGPVATTPDDRGGSPHGRHEAAGVHHPSRRRSNVAARGARAAAYAGASGRCGICGDPSSRNARSQSRRSGFVHGLRDLGWTDGANIIIRSAEGDPQRAPSIFAELLAYGVDVLMVGGVRWLQDAAQRATREVPTITDFSEDPVAAGLIASLARPGGNLTGVTQTTGPEFYSKQLQLLQEMAPSMSRAAFLGPRLQLELYRAAVPPTGVAVIPVLLDVRHDKQAVIA
jgi:hypothetical protein